MRLFAVLAILLVALPRVLWAESRIALVIGNSAYQSVATLDNAENDASLMATSLEGVGFEVTLLTDASQLDLRRGIANFGRSLRAAGPDTIGLFYYAGHGVQSFGANYLLPVDASLTDAADLDLVALEAASVLRQMASARNRTNIVILDACRNNPFEDILDLNDNGLAEMNAPTGTYLAYSTAPGMVAFDGEGMNSPFTSALARNIGSEGVPIEQVFKAVRVEVLDETKGLQIPWDTSSLTQNFVFNPARQLTAEQVAEQQLWESVKAARDSVQLMLFLRSYPSGLYESEARALLSQTMAEELETALVQTPAEPAPAPEPEPIPDPEPAPEPEPEPESASGPAVTSDDPELLLMETAQSTGQIEDYQAYLDAFPNGIFAAFARAEIENLRENASLSVADTGAVAETPAPEVAAPVEIGRVLYDVPLTVGAPEIIGKTIAEVAQGMPLFSPIEGLPEEMWKEQTCASCHQWTREALCDQGKTYASEAGSRALGKEHPYGGTFKSNLRAWAQGGCE